MKDEITVATPRAEVIAHRERMQTVTDLLAGQQAMRDAGVRYIRKPKSEPQAKWQARVDGATLLNGYERTLSYLSGQVFSKDAKLEDEDTADDIFKQFCENCDGMGNNLSVFSKRLFVHSINDGFSLVLVDSAAVTTREVPGVGREYQDTEGEWLPLTRANEDLLGLRPRFVEVRAENVLGWRYELEGGQTRLVMLRLLETYQIPGKWDCEDETREQVRVLTPGAWQVWRRQDESKADSWMLDQEGALPGTEIPVAVLRLGKALDDLTCAPALESLANKNVEHFQKQAGHNWMMQWVREPGMYVTGASAEDEVPWGIGVLTKLSEPTGKIAPIGVDSASVAASMEELKDLEAQMALFGFQMLIPQTGNITATEKALSAGESDSTLKGWAQELKDCLEQALTYVAEYAGMDPSTAPGIIINTDFHAISGMDDAKLNALNTACNNGNLPREVLWSEFRRCGIIAEEWSPEDIQDLLAKQQRDASFQGPAARLLGASVPAPAQGAVGSPASSEQ